MEIVNTQNFKLDNPPEKVKNYYLYMTDDPRMRPGIYFSFTAGEQNLACSFLGSFNMPMRCLQIRGTESEALEYKEKLEEERRKQWEAWSKEPPDNGPSPS